MGWNARALLGGVNNHFGSKQLARKPYNWCQPAIVGGGGSASHHHHDHGHGHDHQLCKHHDDDDDGVRALEEEVVAVRSCIIDAQGSTAAAPLAQMGEMPAVILKSKMVIEQVGGFLPINEIFQNFLTLGHHIKFI